MEKISIIVPVYNVEPYLSKCVESLCGQTYGNLEIILVDDGSVDDSGRIMEQYSQQDARVKAIFQSRNMGVSVARNRGLEEATGDWIAFCDSDDWYLPEAMEKLLNCAHRENADYIVCNYQLVSDGKPGIPVDITAGIRENLNNQNVVACGPVSSCCHLFARALFAKSGARYPEGIGHFEELPVVPVLAKYATRIAVVNEPLYCYYQRSGGSASNTTTDIEQELLDVLGRMGQALGEGFEAEATYHGIYCLMYGNLLQKCKAGATGREMKECIARYEKLFPQYQRNEYYRSLGIAKRAFLWFERRRWYWAMRLLARIHSILVH